MDDEPQLDPLTDVLRLVHVSGALFSRAQGFCPWGVHTRGGSSGIFHVFLRGEGTVRVYAPTTRISPLATMPFCAGDVLVLPHGHPHALSDAPDGTTTWIRELPRAEGPLPVVFAGHAHGAPDTEILCGTLDFAGDTQSLLPHLPPVMRACGGATARWLEASVSQLADEVDRRDPGSELIISKLAEILFIQAVRAWVASPSSAGPGWLRALADPPLARALALLHGAPEKAWSIDHLARRAGLSRSLFYDRFSEVVGEPPAAYLLRWRMTLARRALRDPKVSIPEVATRVGYGSEAAFNRAFKRVVGVPPGAWRRAAA